MLITGGAGYIGSHFVKYVTGKEFNVTVIDNLSRGHREAVPAEIDFYRIDLLDKEKLFDKIAELKPEIIVHFAGFAYVGESVEKPGRYYENNVVGSINLINAAAENGVRKFVFSSTCSLYGNPETVPINETFPVNPINPYASSKMVIEQTLADFSKHQDMRYVSLRYFNAAGAHPNGELGESHDPEPHLIPLVIKTALGEREKVTVFGNDYDTPDGTCIRDFIHVQDLADAHLKAIEYLNAGNNSVTVNLGTGRGNSVMEIIDTVSRITGEQVPYVITGRRAGDPAKLIADNKKAKKVLNWIPEYNLDDIINTALKWHTNPKF